MNRIVNVGWASLTTLGLGLVALVGLPVRAQQPAGSDERTDVLFSCPFDGSLQPKTQKGQKRFTSAAPPEFVKGLKGKALVTGHAKGVVFPLKGNINLVEGAIKLWVMPIDWKVGDGLFHHFFRIVGQKPAANKTAREFDLILYKFAEWDTVVAFGMAGELTGSNLVEIPMDPMWKPKKWHQIVFTWDREGATLYVDAKGKTQKYLRGPPDAFFVDSFIIGGPYFVENKTLTAIDEVVIYGRKLIRQEVDEMYRTELIESAMLR